MGESAHCHFCLGAVATVTSKISSQRAVNLVKTQTVNFVHL